MTISEFSVEGTASVKDEMGALARDDTGRVTSDYEPSALEIQVTRDAICREFGNNGTDGYYIRILKAAAAARAAAPSRDQVSMGAVKELRKAADEMRQEDQPGWPVTCDIAADHIEAIRAAAETLLSSLDPDTLNPEQFNAFCALQALSGGQP